MSKKTMKYWSKEIVKTLKDTPLLKPSYLFKILDPKEKYDGLVEDALRDLVASGAVILNSNRKLYVSEVRLGQKTLRDQIIKAIANNPKTKLSKIAEKFTKNDKNSKNEVGLVLRNLVQDGTVLVDVSWKLSLAKEKKNVKYY